MTRISDFSAPDELRFDDRIQQMRIALAALGARVVSGINNMDPVAADEVAISGLSAVASGTAVTIRWNPILAQNLLRYEVLIGSLADGSDGVIRETTQPEYTDAEGGPGVTRYARVRAILADGTPLPWTETINLNSGLLVTDSLEFAAALNYVLVSYGDGLSPYLAEGLLGRGGGVAYRIVTDSGIDATGADPAAPPVYAGADLQEVYVAQVIITTIGGPVQVRVSAVLDYFISFGGGIELAILRNGDAVLDFGRLGFGTTWAMPYGNITTYAPGISYIELPPAGTHVYELRVRAPVTGGLAYALFFQLRMGVLEFRR
jgi:hypothetical protein